MFGCIMLTSMHAKGCKGGWGVASTAPTLPHGYGEKLVSLCNNICQEWVSSERPASSWWLAMAEAGRASVLKLRCKGGDAKEARW